LFIDLIGIVYRAILKYNIEYIDILTVIDISICVNYIETKGKDLFA